MIKIFNANKELKLISKKQLDFIIEHELDNADKTLTFFVPINSREAEEIEQEGYIQTKDQEYVIKEVNKNNNTFNVVAKLNLEDFEGKHHKSFESITATIEGAINLAIVGTGWTVAYSNITKKRTIRKVKIYTLELIQHIKKIYNAELVFNSLEKKIYIYDHIGSYKGSYVRENINLTQLSAQSNSYDFYTRVEAEGADGLTFADINGGKSYVEDYSYSSKIKTYFWKDERYTNSESLLEDARIKLEEMARPRFSYSVEMINLIREGKQQQSYELGDTIELVSKSLRVKELQRIVKLVEYPDTPEKNYVELSNTLYNLEDMNNKFEDATDILGNITNQDGTIDGSTIDGISTEQIYDFEASVAKITDLTVINAQIENLYAVKASIGELNAVIANIGELNATKANITDLTAINAQIENLQATKIEVTDLTATNIKFEVASGGVLDLQTLLAKHITGENGQFINISSDNTVIANAVIKDAMIENISVSKLLAGTISTNKFTISSDDGGITIVGPTMQFKDKSNKVRIQMGQDTKGNFNFILRGEDGTTTLIDHTGIKEKAIADDLIKENMVAADAIGEKQINYSSLITGLNKDTNTSLIKASKVAIDFTGQSLEVSFNSLKSNVDGLEIGGRNLLTGTSKEFKSVSFSGWDYYFPYINNIKEGDVFSAKIYLKPTVHDTKVMIEFRDESGSVYSQYISEEKITVGNEGYVSVSATCPKGKTKVRMSIRHLSKQTTNNTVQYKEAKFERGNKPTDWTPAPEDVEEKIEVNTTAISVAQGQISGLISESSIIKGDITTISDKYTSLKTTVDGINTTVASHTSSIGTINTNISGLSGKVTTVENKYTSLEQNLNGFKTTVANNYSTKTELSGVDGKVTSLTSRVSTSESSIDQLNNQIKLKVEATDVTNAINNVKVGGDNVLRNGNFANGLNNWSTHDMNSGGTSKGILVKTGDGVWSPSDKKVLIIQGTNTTDRYGVRSSTMKLIPNTKYTISGYCAGHRVGKIQVNVRDVKNADANIFTQNFTPVSGGATLDKWYRFELTLTTTSNTEFVLNLYSVNMADNGYVWFSDVQIQIGTKATAWTPCAEDIDSAITSVDSRVTTTSNKVATIEANLNSITQRVSSTETTLNSTTTTANNALNTANTANSNINNLQIGGRNLAQGTSSSFTNAYTSFTGGTNTCPSLAKVLTDGLSVGDTVTVKLIYKFTNIVATSGQTAKCWIQGSGNSTVWNSGGFHSSPQKTLSGSGEHTFLYSFKVTSDHLKNSYWDTNIRHDYVQSGSVQWKMFKVEKGTRSTDWTPAHEDVSNSISSLISRMNSAEQKITDSAIISTVQATINTAKTEAINSANSSTDTKLKNYSTTTQMNTAIEQKANSITNTVSSTYLSKSDATNTYATKSSLTQTTDKIIADFKASGGYNLLKNSDARNGTSFWSSNGGGLSIGTAGLSPFEGQPEFKTSFPSGMKYNEDLRLKSNTDYVYEAWIYTNTAISSSSITPLHFWCSSSAGTSGQSQCTIIDYRQTLTQGRFSKVYVHFKTKSGNVFFRPFIYSTATASSITVKQISLSEGTVEQPWSPHPDEVYSGSTVIDASGVTVNNGALRVKNNAGTTVLEGDSSGNLTLKNGCFKVLSSSGNEIASINQNNWMRLQGLELFGAGECMQNKGTGVRSMKLISTDGKASHIDFNENSSVEYTVRLIREVNSKSLTIYGNGMTIMPTTSSTACGLEMRSQASTAYIDFTSNQSDDYHARLYLKNNDKNLYTAGTGLIVQGNLNVTGSKNCLQATKSYGDRLINAYETAECYYGDLGFGKINEDGECVVYIDDIFQECVNTDIKYHVFTQAYNGAIKTIERYKTYFIVKGTPGTEFSWEFKAKRIGHENTRLDTVEIDNFTVDGLKTFKDEDFLVDTVEDTLLDILTFDLENLLMEG